MPVATLRLELRLADCQTARQKRVVLEGIIDKLRRHFHVAVAEVEKLDRPAEAVLLAASVGRNRAEAREPLRRAADALGVHPHAEVVAQAFRDL